MLEKIGLPAKPSLRGSNWVVDASHCQGCSSQFTFINRKHHCRRCGGLFCNSCTQQRMILRGQGDSPVRICESCKKLEEAARFEMRHGYKSRAGKGGSKLTGKSEDEVLNKILGTDGKGSFSSGLSSNNDMGSSIQRATSSASSSETHDGLAGIGISHSVDDHNFVKDEMGSSTPEELRQRALEEKKKYKILKGEGKPEEALRAYKRGKELERQAEALEISMRKSRKRILSSGSNSETQDKDGSIESAGRNKHVSKAAAAEKNDFAAELRELGWSDMDIQDENKALPSMSLEGELSSLLGDVSKKTTKDKDTHGIDKTPVIALKRKALLLKRDGKLAEAKEELKKAKVLEKQLEEQELLADAEDSDDELSAIIQSMDNDEQDDFLIQYEQEPGLDHLVGAADDLGVDSNFEVTDEDMQDPEIASALKSLGWTDDSNDADNIIPHSAPLDRAALSREIISLKREALNQKRAGNVAEAMAQLKKAKLLERDLESYESRANNLVAQNPKVIHTGSVSQAAEVDDGSVDSRKYMDTKVSPKSRLVIQKELLGLKKKALALRREGKLDEAEEELKKGKVLEHQLEEMDNASKVKAGCKKEPDLTYKDPVVSLELPVGVGEDNVTDQDMHDPSYLSILRDLGWNDDDNEPGSHPSKPSWRMDNPSEKIMGSSSSEATSDVPARASRRSKAEIQGELLGLKRKALAMRRQGKADEAEEVLNMAKVLEAEMADIETPKRVQVESNWPKDRVNEHPLESPDEKGGEDNVTEEDMHNPALLSALKNLASKDEELEPFPMQEKPSAEVSGNPLHSTGSSIIQSGVSVVTPRSKGEIQRQLLDLKRKALALRRKGEIGEAEELLKMAKLLEAQMEDLEAPMEHQIDTSEAKESSNFESLKNHEKQGDLIAEVGVNIQSTPVTAVSNDNAVGSSHCIEDKHPLLGELGRSGETGLPINLGKTEGSVFISPSDSANSVDLLTGNNWTCSQVPAGKPEDKWNFGSHISSTARSSIQSESLSNLQEDLGSKNDVQTQKRTVNAYENPRVHEANVVRAYVSQNNQTSIQQDVLAHKRKAVALKREGKLTEAREELRRAKLLEKSLEEDNIQPKTSVPDASMSTYKAPSDGQKEHDAPNLALPKPLSARDRFKLQQESLSHKRKALKLRREGRTDEAEAEFEMAKNLEAQLEELAAHDSKAAANEAEVVDDVTIEDLDPQILSALKAIGLHDSNVVSQVPERPEPVKLSARKSENLSQERIQLEERIKAEKVKAVNLKRSGKQSEALDALRRAKLFEKKLNSLASN